VKKIVSIRVTKSYESCERTTYWVELKTDEGLTMTPESFATGSIYTDYIGLSKDEARDRALMTAHEWGDFLDIEVTPYIEEGVAYEPSMKMETYTGQREDRAFMANQ
jgi:hypothetical protein